MADSIAVDGGNSLPAAKFTAVGEVHQGVITGVSEVQETDFATKQKKFWHPTNGSVVLGDKIALEQLHLFKPVIQWAIELDNRVVVWAKGNLMAETKKAIKAAGETSIRVGGQWAGKLVELKDTGKGQPAKIHQVKYVAPKSL